MKALEYIKSFFSKNAGWKVGSIILAIILWFFVMNTLNPSETKSFSVPITLINEDALTDGGYAVLNTEDLKNTRVEIKVRATRTALDNLPKQNDTGAVQATIDFAQFDTSRIVSTPQNLVLDINPKIDGGFLYTYEVASLSPANVSVVFDKVQEKEVKLTTNFTGGLDEGYTASIEQLSADTVTVYGPESEFKKLGSVIAEIVLTKEQKDDFTTELRPVVFNTNGEMLPNFIVRPSEITAKINVAYTRTIEILKPETTGTLNKELILKGIDWSPKSLELTGDKEVLDSLQPIKLTAIELDKLVGSDIRTYEVSQFINDPRISAKPSSPRVITVTIELAGKDGKNITLNAEDISVKGLSGGLKALMPSQVVFTVFGEPDALESITNSSFNASVDLTDCGEGAAEVPLDVSLPAGLEIRGETKVYVYITRSASASSDNIDDTEDTTESVIEAAAEVTSEAIHEITEPATEKTEEPVITEEVIETETAE